MYSIYDMLSLKGKVAMVTGGAQNLGLQMAEALAEAGADLAITSRKLEKAVEAAAGLSEQFGASVLPLGLDVTNEENVRQVFSRVVEEFGRLDVVINNAGGGRGKGVVLDRSVDDWKFTVELNLTGTFICSREAARVMIPQGSGSIINIASMSGLIGRDRWVYEGSPNMVPNALDYTAAKGGVIAFTKDLAAALGEHDIRVNAICPGGFERGQPAEFIKRYNKQTMLHRMGTDGKDLKGAALLLASEAGEYITGHALVVDGGFTAW